jgi:site-specific DNA recombinase
VKRIFEMSAAGAGLTRITKALNEDGVPAPRPQQGRPVGWALSTVRSVLLRELYRGMIVWNQSRKRDRWGQQHQQARPQAEWMRVPAAHLRIVSDVLWHAAQSRREARTPRQTDTAPAVAVRSRDVDAKYLLTGFGRCAVCGGVWRGHTRDHGREPVRFYGCANHAKRGARVCSNGLVARTAAIDAEVIATLAEDVLRPTVIDAALALAFEELAPAGADRARRTLEAELTKVTDECRPARRGHRAGDSLPCWTA